MKIIKAEQLQHGRRESWKVTFSEAVNDHNKPEALRLLQGLSYLWQTTVTTVSPDTVIYQGWTD